MKLKTDPTTTNLDRALEFASKIHQDQTYGNVEYIQHPVHVALVISSLLPDDENLLMAAFLHDTIETGKTNYEELAKRFNKDVATLVQEVTKEGYNTFPSLVSRRGVILKFADRLSNLINMESWDLDRQEVYIKKSKFWKP